jgi:glutamate-1-semialdehyde 2,1-aminomutase
MHDERSKELFRRALARIPGGVNSPVRAWSAVGGSPRFVASAQGARIRDVDGREYVDYVGSWGPMILGHRHPSVIAAIEEALARGTSFGACTELEVRLAERICELVPSIERVRLVSSGTEATMSALRVARAATGRKFVVKFAGCYHGHADGLLVRAGSGATTFGAPDSPGVPQEIAGLTRLARFNDLSSVEEACDGDTAAIIVEPVAANMGVVAPEPGFLPGLREIADRHGALLVFDEVITGFRVALGGYQSLCGVRPDLTCLGKILGGGLPVGAYGGSAGVMDQVAPQGAVYQAGTLSGNPLAVAAGLATLERLVADPPYERLERLSARLEQGLARAASGERACVRRAGSILTLFLGLEAVRDYDDARTADTRRFGEVFQGLLDQGVWIAPSQFEAWFVSAAHTEDEVERTIAAAGEVFSASC